MFRSPAGLPVAVRVGFWMLVSSVNFALMLAIARNLSAELPVFVIAFWRNFFAALLFVPWAIQVGPTRLLTRSFGLHVGRATCLVASSTALFLAAALMPIGEVTAISFTTPLFAVLLAALFLRERLTPVRLIGLAGGFAGMLVMLRPGAAAFDPVALYVIFASLTFGGVVVLGRVLAQRDSPALMVALLSLISVPLSLLPALLVWDWPDAVALLWLVGMAVFGSLHMYGIVQALRIAEASLSQPYDFLRLPATALVGYLAFAEVPDAWTWAGAAIICVATVWVTRAESRSGAGAA